MGIKVIFLDIDGVLNNCIDKIDLVHGVQGISERCTSLLQQIVTETDAKIIISSTWRLIHSQAEIEVMLREAGFIGEVIGMTSKHKCGIRGCEINEWLKTTTYEIDNYVILDDDSDMLLWQANNFVNVDGWAGLTEVSAYKAKRILNRAID